MNEYRIAYLVLVPFLNDDLKPDLLAELVVAKDAEEAEALALRLFNARYPKKEHGVIGGVSLSALATGEAWPEYTEKEIETVEGE